MKILRSHKAGRINPSLVLRCKLPLVLDAVMLGERDVELEPLRKIANNEKIKLYEGWSYEYMAEILLNLGSDHISESEKWIRKAIDANTRNKMKFRLGKTHALYGDYF